MSKSVEELRKKRDELRFKVEETDLLKEIKVLEKEEDEGEKSDSKESVHVPKAHPLNDLHNIAVEAHKKGPDEKRLTGQLSEALAKIERLSTPSIDTHLADVYIERHIQKKYGARGSEVVAFTKDLQAQLPKLDLASQALRVPLWELERFKRWFPGKGKKDFKEALQCLALQNTEITYSRKTLDTINDTSWIPTDLASQLSLHIMKAKAVPANVPSFDQPTNPFDWPISASPNTTFLVTESAASDVTVLESEPNDAKITYAAKKLANRVDFSEEMNEDAVFALMSTIQRIMADSLGDAFDRGVIFGDETTDTTNINLIGATPTTTAGQADAFLVADGMVHFALIIADGSNVDIGSASSISAGIATIYSNMGPGALDPRDLLIIVPPSVHFKMLTDTNIVTLDKFGSGATILTGQVAAIFGSPVVTSSGIPATDATGNVDGVTAANNTKGSIVVVKLSKVSVGFRRRMKVASEFQPLTDKTNVVASMRFDFQQLTNNIASNNAIGYGFNVTV